jgi:hypothetical protein
MSLHSKPTVVLALDAGLWTWRQDSVVQSEKTIMAIDDHMNRETAQGLWTIPNHSSNTLERNVGAVGVLSSLACVGYLNHHQEQQQQHHFQFSPRTEHAAF